MSVPILRETISVPIFLAAVAFASLGGCGYIGPPLPPALNIPLAPDALQVMERGDRLVIEATLPKLTTDGVPLTNTQSIDIYIGPSMTNFSIEPWSKTATRYEQPGHAPGPLEYSLPVTDWAGKEVVIAVRAVGLTGRSSGWSATKRMTIGVPLDPPGAVTARNALTGVELIWTGKAPRYRILRATVDAKESPAKELQTLGESPINTYIDDMAVNGMTYRYVIVALGSASGVADQESLASDPISFTPADVFAPTVPTGLSAVATGQTIELAWARSTEDDFRGYNLFRSVDGGAPQKIASLVEAPVYSDSMVPSGHRYRYTLTAVDTAGNESGTSVAVEVAIP